MVSPQVMQQLCDNHLSLVFLAQILPSLGNFIHDTSERVRTAMLELLLKLKGVRPIKFYHVVPIEHLLSRLVDKVLPCDVDKAPYMVHG